MSCYQYQSPSDWASYRNIDEDVKIDADAYLNDNLDDDNSENAGPGGP